MTTVRTMHDKTNPYVIINKQSLWDKNLSLEAAGLWGRLLSRPDDWEVNVPEIAQSCGVGKDKIYRIFNELLTAGYVIRIQNRNKSGRVAGFGYFIFESKELCEQFKKENPPSNPLPEKPFTENPDTETLETETLETVPKGAPIYILNKEYTNILSPIIPKGDTPLSTKRKKIKEEKVEVAPDVWITPRQQKNFEEERLKGNFAFAKTCYKTLSEWKISKEIIGGNDYQCLISWVIKATEEKCQQKKNYQTGSTNSKQKESANDSPERPLPPQGLIVEMLKKYQNGQ